MAELTLGFYTHFKGGRYEVLHLATHSETREAMVVYRALYGDGGVYVRPLDMWLETVERGGVTYRRFVPEGERNQVSEAAPPVDGGALLASLMSVFGYSAFREGQGELIAALIHGRDAVGVMPTGSGKSICYQLPAINMDGTALVVSPLISLMKDQVTALTEAGISAAYLNSSLTAKQFDRALERMAQGQYKVVYVAPERLMTSRFLEAARRMKISLVAVDEAHCLSHWGQDFRPSYLSIPDFIAQLPVRPPVGAYTATATQRVREDIVHLLKLHAPLLVSTGFDRPNLFFEVLKPAKRDQVLLSLMERYEGESGIIYCATRKNVEKVHELLKHRDIPAARYHAGLSDEERRRSQEDFSTDKAQVIVATNAFGMGIDKSNVRFVIHYNMPADIESYYQEAGRAGRDGEQSDCVLLYSKQDIITQRFLIDQSREQSELTGDEARTVYRASIARLYQMIDYAESSTCLRARILKYFGEKDAKACGHCSFCAPRGEAAPAPDKTRAEKQNRKRSACASGDQDQALFERLRALRLRLAVQQNIPAYQVFSDKTLLAMCRIRPRDKREMLTVPGVGEAKLGKYAGAFLAVLNGGDEE